MRMKSNTTAALEELGSRSQEVLPKVEGMSAVRVHLASGFRVACGGCFKGLRCWARNLSIKDWGGEWADTLHQNSTKR